jgi:hypothetical protein
MTIIEGNSWQNKKNHVKISVIKIISMALLVIFPYQLYALNVKAGAPTTYTIQPGDTLIGIAEQYLDNPLEWPQLLKNNPQIENPYRLYPGEVLTLELNNGVPHVRVENNGVIKLSPQIRSQAISTPVPIIPLETIKPFLNGTRVVSKDELKYAPYIVAQASEHVTSGLGDKVYGFNVNIQDPNKDYSIFREGKTYKDPRCDKILGYEALYIGDATVIQVGQPATLLITKSDKEVLVKDKLLPTICTPPFTDFIIKKPICQIDGDIISVVDGVTQIGQYDVVVIDRGLDAQLAAGNILSIYTKGKIITNPITLNTGFKPKVKLPDEWVGDLMVFRVFDNVSYGVVLHATGAIHVNDFVRSPSYLDT